ncbi:MAG: hypothetical protein EA350_01240 [Gemmatimonadales bacterium]|nr:MAG: hypothetical protein EA350_01240 [Gemmatimonadales bacterium]
MHRVAFLLLLIFASSGCERGFPTAGSEPTIPEDEFVEAMAELRTATFRQEGGTLPVSERDEILRRRGLAPEDLVKFAEVHGPDVPFMFAVWARVDSAVVAASTPSPPGEADSPPPGDAPPGVAPPGAAVPGDGIER